MEISLITMFPFKLTFSKITKIITFVFDLTGTLRILGLLNLRLNNKICYFQPLQQYKCLFFLSIESDLLLLTTNS